MVLDWSRKEASANVEETDDSDLHTSRSIGDAGLAMSLLKAETEAYIELQNQAFADIAGLRSHLEAEEQQCRGSAERIKQLDRWRAISELQAQHMNMKYQGDMQEKTSVIAGLEQRDLVRDQNFMEGQLLALRQCGPNWLKGNPGGDPDSDPSSSSTSSSSSSSSSSPSDRS